MAATMLSPTHRLTTRIVAFAVAAIVGMTVAPEALAQPGLAKAAAAVTVTAPTLVKSGATIAVTITTDASYDGSATLYYRTDEAWVESALPIAVTKGKGTASWKASSSRGYYIALAGAGSSAPFSVSVEDSSRYGVTARFSASDIASGEMVWARGTVTLAGTARNGATVVLERKKPGASWTAITTATSNSSGAYSIRVSPSPSYAYRVRISGRATISAPATISALSSDRTLETRASQLDSILGSATDSIKNIDGGSLPPGVDAARYRAYRGGTLVEITASGRVRTWLVYDRIGSKWESLGDVGSKLGLPVRDPKCALLESGCVQRFYGGSAYVNSSAMSPGVYIAYGTRVDTELVAAAYSQVGYEEPSWRVNKYTAWLGSRPAWCMTFVAWSAAASGNAGMVPASGSYESYLKTLKASGRLHYSGVPPIGSVVLYDWGSGTPSHTAFVTSHSGSYLWSVEGNTTDGTGDPQRGVYHRKRSLSYVWAWYWPSES